MKLAHVLKIYAEDQMYRPKDYGQPLVNSQDYQKTVCVDFDGVLAGSSGPYKRGHIGGPNAQGLLFLQLLLDDGFKIVVLTARKETDLVARWLGQQGFPGLFVTNHKVPAIAYIDDHAAHWHDDQDAMEMLDLVRKAAR